MYRRGGSFLSFLLFLAFCFSLAAADARAVIEPKERTLLTSEISSTVEAINRKMGESFLKGEELIRLDNVIFFANLEKAKAVLAKARADFSAAKQLWQDKVISHSDYRTAEASEATAEAELAIADKAYRATIIRAPYDGKVINVYVKLYERIEQGNPLIEILDDNVLVAKLLIPERYFDRVKIGGELSLHIIEVDRTVGAKVVRIGAVIDPVSSLFKVEAEIDNASGALRAGMEGTLEFEPAETTPQAPLAANSEVE